MEVRDVLRRDAIPSIDDPSFGADYFGDGDDEVLVVEADPPRAYPIRVLSHHEIVNDVLGSEARSEDAERPIAVTWCPISASAVVYDRRIDDQTLTFGTSGNLADDALVMYDRYDGDSAFGLRAMRGEGPERSWERTDIDAKTTVVGVVRGGDAVGYPVPQIRAAGGVVTDTVGGLDLVVAASSEIGTHVFENPGYEFELRDGTLYGDGVV